MPIESAAKRLEQAIARLEQALAGRGEHQDEEKSELAAALAAAEAEQSTLVDANRAAAEKLDFTINRLRSLLA